MSILLEVTDMNVHDVYPTDDVEVYLLDGGGFPLESACDRVAIPLRDFLARELGNPMSVGDTLPEP
jgi:hypothetical protein